MWVETQADVPRYVLVSGDSCPNCGGPFVVENEVVSQLGTRRLSIVRCADDAHHHFEMVTTLRRWMHPVEGGSS